SAAAKRRTSVALPTPAGPSSRIVWAMHSLRIMLSSTETTAALPWKLRITYLVVAFGGSGLHMTDRFRVIIGDMRIAVLFALCAMCASADMPGVRAPVLVE